MAIAAIAHAYVFSAEPYHFLPMSDMLKLGWLHVNPVKGKVDEERNIVLVELDVGIASTKLLVEVEPAEPSQQEASSSDIQNEEYLQTYSLAKDQKRMEIHPLV